jgi:hypothetical protein
VSTIGRKRKGFQCKNHEQQNKTKNTQLGEKKNEMKRTKTRSTQTLNGSYWLS